ncbi:MAG: hypothetical protein ACQET8_22675 [Bacillota bacterium]
MSFVEMNQSIVIKHVQLDENGDPKLDEMGYPLSPIETTYSCRVDEGSKLVKFMNSGNVTGKTPVIKARILLDGLVNVRYEDSIVYTNELGVTIERVPEEINVKRWIDNSPFMTEVFI